MVSVICVCCIFIIKQIYIYITYITDKLKLYFVYCRWSLLTDAKKYFQPEIGLLDFPVYIHVHTVDHDPPPPIVVNVMAVMTSPCALSIHPAAVNFGYVSTMETVKTSLYLTNHSSSVYSFGFTNLPQVSCVVFLLIIINTVRHGRDFTSEIGEGAISLNLCFRFLANRSEGILPH